MGVFRKIIAFFALFALVISLCNFVPLKAKAETQDVSAATTTGDADALSFVCGNEATTSVSTEIIEDKETVVYTTEGMQLDNNGYGRPVKMVLSDTSKEVIKFRFQFASCDANLEKLTFNYLVGVNADVNNGNYGNYVVLDENGNVTYEYEVGKWYTFYGRTMGKENLYLWTVTNCTEMINVTMYFQDAVALDYEPTVNIRQENTAFYGNAAPYQDAEGNWLVHYRSFTGSGAEGVFQHGNTAWDRRTYIDIPENYNYASFEFRFNVSQYAAADAELATNIEGFSYLGATYFDMNDTPVAVSDMVVGKWYRAVFAAPVEDGYGNKNYTIAMGFKNGGSGATVNIDMDYRNAYGFNSAEITNPYTPIEPHYGKVTPVKLGDEVIYKHHLNYTNDATNAILRGLNVNQTGADKKIMSVKVCFESVSNMATPAISVYRSDSGVLGYAVTDAQGNVVDPMNLELKQWYTVTWLANGGINTYQIRPYTGGHKTTESGEPAGASGDYYLTNVTVRDYVDSSLLTGNYYTWVLDVPGTDAHMVHVRFSGDGATFDAHRYVEFPVLNESGDTISADIMIGAYGTNSLLKVRNASGADVPFTITDSEGNAVESTAMVKGQWYKLTWTADGSATYKIHSFDGDNTGGKLAGNGTYYLKNLTNEDYVPATSEVTFVTNRPGVAAPNSITVTEAQPYGTLPTLADQAYYTFAGWYTDAACTSAVTAATKVTAKANHNLYAKWEEKTADTSSLTFATDYYVDTTTVYRDMIADKETVVFTTEGNRLDPNGYGRPVKMVLADTSKEVIKFRFQFASCDADLEKLTFNYAVGVLADVNSGNYGNYVVLDENGNVTYEYEVGKWYTFYGRTLGKENLYLWTVTNCTEKINVTMYFQDREVLDYEPEVNIRQEGTAFFGNAAPYQDAEGNWLVHYRSFTGSGAEGALHHNNTAWDRRTYLDIPATYDYASFEFRFNVSQYAAAGAELADKIVAFEYLKANYFDMNGNPVVVADMVVGQWYRAVFANPIPTSTNYTIAMGTVQPGSGAIVNIDIDYRNATGFNTAELSNPFLTPAGGDMYNTNTPAGPSGYYSSVTPIQVGNEVIYKHYIWQQNDGTTAALRRTHLTTTAAEKQVISMKIYFESCSATPSIEILRKDKIASVYLVSDANGNVVDPLNLQTKQWYTVSWLADKDITEYRIHPITGEKAYGTYFIKDINVQTVEGLLTSEYYGWAIPYAEGQYLVNVRVTGDVTGIGDRKISLNIANGAKDTISMDIQFTQFYSSATSLLKIKNAAGAEMALTITDSDGNAVESTAMVLGEWYKVSFTADGSAKYTIHTFDGSATGGKYFLKNIQNTVYVPAVYDVSFNLGYEGETPATIQVTEGNAYGELPTVADRQGYIFDGWYMDAEFNGEAVTAATIVNGSHTLYAKWTAIQYTITFVDYDNTTLSTGTYTWGQEVVAPADPVRDADNTYTYTFTGWDAEVVNCAGDATYKATYTGTYIEYIVKFLDENGDVISEKTYHYGEEIEVPEDPTKASDNTYTYEFAGWNSAVSETCEGNAEYTATYTGTYIEYTVKFLDENGDVLGSGIYHFGQEIEVPADPTKAPDNTYTYTFAGWDAEVVPCAGDATYKATYTQEYIEYTVTFQYEDGTVISSATYHYGDTIVAPADPESLEDGFMFKDWDKEVGTCTGNETFTAVFTVYVMDGDVNGDGKLTGRDAIYLLFHTFSAENYPINGDQDCDFNSDGIVDGDDAVYLLYHTFIPDVYPLYPNN